MKNPEKRTRLGQYITAKGMIQKAIGEKTGLSDSRLSTLCTNPTSHLRADELYKIALALGDDPCKLLQRLCGHITLTEVTLPAEP